MSLHLLKIIITCSLLIAPALQCIAQGSGSGGSEAIRNERKSKGSSLFSLERVKEINIISTSPRVDRSELLKEKKPFTPPGSESENPVRSNGQKRARTTSNASFIKNEPSMPLHVSRRDRELAIGRWDLGVSLGTSHSITDIQRNKDLGFVDFLDNQSKNFNAGVGAFGRYVAANWFAVKGGLNYAWLSGTNEPAGDPYDNYSFENNIYEFFLKTEFHAPFLRFNPSSIYLFTGVSVFISNDLLLDDEGQQVDEVGDFESLQPAMPLGVGYFYQFSNGISIGYEFGWRFTLYHYLDGLKIDNSYDQYFFNFITVSYSLERESTNTNLPF